MAFFLFPGFGCGFWLLAPGGWLPEACDQLPETSDKEPFPTFLLWNSRAKKLCNYLK